MTICNHKHGLMLAFRHDIDRFTRGRIVLSLPKRVHVNWNWPISREKYQKIDWSEILPLHRVELQAPGNRLLKLSNMSVFKRHFCW